MAILRFTPSPDEEMSPEELSALLTSMMPEIHGYRVMRRIGKGGMSFVYLALQESLDRQVAIKITAPEILREEISKQRFEQEARTIAKLEHPCIVGIYEVGRSPQGLMYYVMPYLSKGHLGQRDMRNDEGRIIDVLRSLLSALGYAHTRGIVHRDVKAENVLFDNADRPVLADFGIALPFRSSTRITNVGFAVGSAAYMAPEQARGDNVDGRADIYAMGVLAYEMLTGRLPFQGNDALALAVMHAHDPIPPLPANRRHWQAFISTAMAKGRDQRFRNAEQMLNALDDLEKRVRGRTTAEVHTAELEAAIAARAAKLGATHRPGSRLWFGLAASALIAAASVGLWVAQQEPSRPDFVTAINSPASVVEDPIGAAAIAAGAGAAAAATPAPAALPSAPGLALPVPPVAFAASAFVSSALAYDPRIPAAREFSAAKRQIARLRLTMPLGDNAVDSLTVARALAPRDPQFEELGTRLITALGDQLDKALASSDEAAASTLWQRAKTFAEGNNLDTSDAWQALRAGREAAIRTALLDAASKRDARLLKRATDDIALFGLQESRFTAEIRAARVALLPRAGARVESRGPAMRLIAVPGENSEGLAAMERKVTRGEFEAFVQATGHGPSRCRGGFLERRIWNDPGFAQTAAHPVVCVTAEDATSYAQWRGERDGVRYRLPTSAEWATLSQGATATCAGARLACDRSEGTVPVGRNAANALGLSDIAGNAREWLAGGRQTAGAGWRTEPASARAGAVQSAQDERGQDDLSFRLVREVSLNELLAMPSSRAR